MFPIASEYDYVGTAGSDWQDPDNGWQVVDSSPEIYPGADSKPIKNTITLNVHPVKIISTR